MIIPTTSLTTVNLYCDGSCSPSGTRAWHGGWCAILVFGDVEKVVSGHSYPETNSTMELQALLSGLAELTRPCQVNFFCDAQYVVKGVNERLEKWKRNGWRTRARQPVAHQDLWEAVDAQAHKHHLFGTWIRGHARQNARSSHQEYNVRCDELAEAEAWKSYSAQQAAGSGEVAQQEDRHANETRDSG